MQLAVEVVRPGEDVVDPKLRAQAITGQQEAALTALGLTRADIVQNLGSLMIVAVTRDRIGDLVQVHVRPHSEEFPSYGVFAGEPVLPPEWSGVIGRVHPKMPTMNG